MRKYIPERLEVGMRNESVSHSSFGGGGASISVYKLTSKSESYILANPSYWSEWADGSSECGSALVFLRDIGGGKDKKIRKYINSKEKIYSRKNVILVPEQGVAITCSASW